MRTSRPARVDHQADARRAPSARWRAGRRTCRRCCRSCRPRPGRRRVGHCSMATCSIQLSPGCASTVTALPAIAAPSRSGACRSSGGRCAPAPRGPWRPRARRASRRQPARRGGCCGRRRSSCQYLQRHREEALIGLPVGHRRSGVAAALDAAVEGHAGVSIPRGASGRRAPGTRGTWSPTPHRCSG